MGEGGGAQITPAGLLKGRSRLEFADSFESTVAELFASWEADRKLPQSAPDATRLSCLQLSMRRDLLFLLFCVLHLALPLTAPPSLPRWRFLCEPRSLPAIAPPVCRPTGRKEGRTHESTHEDIWATALSLPANCRDAAHSTASTVRTVYRRTAVWPGN